jgi:hypothetical protein
MLLPSDPVHIFPYLKQTKGIQMLQGFSFIVDGTYCHIYGAFNAMCAAIRVVYVHIKLPVLCRAGMVHSLKTLTVAPSI